MLRVKRLHRGGDFRKSRVCRENPLRSDRRKVVVFIFFLTALAMLAFAANSVLCRLALAGGDCDPATFTVVRVSSGAVMLVLVNLVRRRQSGWRNGRWDSAAFLALYAA